MEFDKTAVNLGTFARSEHLPSCFKKRLWSSIFTRIKYLPHTFTNWINNPRITHSSQHPLSELCTQIQNESNLTILGLSFWSIKRQEIKMPRAFLVRTKSTAVSSEASHQGVEKGNKQGKYLVVIFQSGFLCYELHISSQLLSGTRRRYASKIPISISLLSGSCIWRQHMRAIRDCFENPSVSPYSKFDLS